MRPAINLISYLTLVLAGPSAANPLSDPGNDVLRPLDKCACQTITTWSGGGCSVAWGLNRCKNRCLDAAGGKGCCSGTVSSSVLANPTCFTGFKKCGCGCLTNP